MEWSPLVELLPALALGVALAACAGLRAFFPLRLAGILARAGWLDLGPSFQFLASNRALVLFGVASLVERSEEHTAELQSREKRGCGLLLEKEKSAVGGLPGVCGRCAGVGGWRGRWFR